MLSLYAVRDGNTAVLDLMESQPISLSFQFQELQDINTATGSFSQSFRLPVTKTNANFFNHADDPDYVLFDYAFNPKRKYEAWISNDGLPIMHGSLQLIQVITRNGRASEYEVIVVGNTGDLITEIRNKKLADLDLRTLDHAFSIAELGVSYDGNGGDQTATGGLFKNSLAPTSTIDSSWEGHFCYSVFDPRSTQALYTNDNGYPYRRLVPFIKIFKIVEMIMAEAGYTFTSNFFGSTGEGYNVWMPIYNGQNWIRFHETTDVLSESWGATTDVDEIPAFTFQGTSYPELDGWEVVSQYTQDYRIVVPFPYDPSVTYGGDPGSDTDGLFQTNGVLEIVEAGIYRFDLDTTWRVTAPQGTNGKAVFHILKKQLTEGEYNWHPDDENQDPTILTATYWLQQGQHTREEHVEDIVCSEGDRFYVVIAQGIEGYNSSTQSYYENSWVVQSYLRAKSIEGTTEANSLVDLNTMMPDMTYVDFMTGLQKTFNLVFVPDEDRKHFTIEPAKDYLYTGDVLDWHDKVDYSSDIVMKPTTDLQSRKYNFEHAEGANYVSVSFQETALRVPGRYKVEDTENDWATGETEVSNGFAPFTPARGTHNLYTLQSYNGQGELLQAGDQPPMLCYGHTMDAQEGTDGIGWWYIQWPFGSTFDFVNSIKLDTITFFSPFSDFPATLTSNALLYGEDRFAEEDEQPVNTLFHKYWEDYFLEQYSTEARIMECRMYLTKADINQLNFADTIHLNEGVFRLLNVSNYTANAEEPCSVTLIRAVSEVRPCEYVPTSGNEFQIFFTDSDGTSGLAGNQKCCTYYGYRWSGDRCLRQQIVIESPTPTGSGIVGQLWDLVGGLALSNYTNPITSIVEALTIDNGLITTLPIGASDEIIKAENIEQSTARNFASTTQLNTIASNTLSIDGNTTSITAIEAKTDFITITSNHNLDTTKTKVGYITTGASGISAFTIEPTAKPLTADQISTTSTTNKFVTQTELNKLSLIGVSTAINLDSVESRVSTNETDITNIESKTGNISLATSGRISSISTDFAGTAYTYIPAYSQWLYTAIPPAEASSGKYVSNMKVLDYGSTTAVEDANLYQIHHLLNGNYAGASTCPPLYSYACNSYAMLDPLNPSDAGHRSGQSGVRLVTIDNTGKLSEISDGTANQLLKTDGSGALSWTTPKDDGWHGSGVLMKVMPHQWTMNDDYNRAPIMVEDDTTGTLGIKMPASATEAYAMIAIPTGYKATHVQVYASASTASAVEAFSYNQTSGAITSKGTGAFNSSIDITDVTSSTTTNLCIKISPASNLTLIYGADVTIAEV